MTDRSSAEWLAAALKVIPGGVNSPVRAFGPVGGRPPFIARAAACNAGPRDFPLPISDNNVPTDAASVSPLAPVCACSMINS